MEKSYKIWTNWGKVLKNVTKTKEESYKVVKNMQ
jgi:hypothetical protein